MSAVATATSSELQKNTGCSVLDDDYETFYARVSGFPYYASLRLYALKLGTDVSMTEGDSVSFERMSLYNTLPWDWYWEPVDRDNGVPCNKNPQYFMRLRHRYGTRQTIANWDNIRMSINHHGTCYYKKYLHTMKVRFDPARMNKLIPLHHNYVRDTGDCSIAHFIALHVHNEWPRVCRCLQRLVRAWRERYYKPGGAFEKLAMARFNQMKNC